MIERAELWLMSEIADATFTAFRAHWNHMMRQGQVKHRACFLAMVPSVVFYLIEVSRMVAPGLRSLELCGTLPAEAHLGSIQAHAGKHYELLNRAVREGTASPDATVCDALIFRDLQTAFHQCQQQARIVLEAHQQMDHRARKYGKTAPEAMFRGWK